MGGQPARRFTVIPNADPRISRIRWTSRVNCPRRKLLFGTHTFLLPCSFPDLTSAQRHGTGLLSSAYFLASAARYLIDASVGVSRAARSPGTPNRRCVLITHIGDHIIYACVDSGRFRQVGHSCDGRNWPIGTDHPGIWMCRSKLCFLRPHRARN